MKPSMRAAQYNTVRIFQPPRFSQFIDHNDQMTNKVEVNEVPIPEPGENDVLIKNVCASLCHSDLVIAPAHRQ